MTDKDDGIKRVTSPEEFGKTAAQLPWMQEASLPEVPPVLAAALNGADGVVPDENGSISPIATNRAGWEPVVERQCDEMAADLREKRSAQHGGIDPAQVSDELHKAMS